MTLLSAPGALWARSPLTTLAPVRTLITTSLRWEPLTSPTFDVSHPSTFEAVTPKEVLCLLETVGTPGRGLCL